ncbi:hypothetical protein, partial [Mesorhizobium sp. M7A.F.Ca.US.007.01.2.1]|uniref:hypothetical protein n=1 Tax=Mesorhizobium sp. M7A.F.Ca.US.007.01.2.1 TaxID=2496711 RepID=UPI0019D10812
DGSFRRPEARGFFRLLAAGHINEGAEHQRWEKSQILCPVLAPQSRHVLDRPRSQIKLGPRAKVAMRVRSSLLERKLAHPLQRTINSLPV